MPPTQLARRRIFLAGGRQRVLVVHIGVRDADDDVAGIQIIERHVDELGADLPLRGFGQFVGFEAFHWLLRLYASFLDDARPLFCLARHESRELRGRHAHYFRPLEIEAFARLGRVEDRA